MYVIEDFQVEVKDLQMGATNRTSYEQMFPGGKGIKMAITKCRQTTDNILKMAEAAFPNKGIPQIEELTEGMCNVAYKLTYEDGFCTILKISSPTLTSPSAAEIKSYSANTGCKCIGFQIGLDSTFSASKASII